MRKASSDLEQGIIRIRREPVTNPTNPLTSFIADDNDNQAWAVFFNAAYDLTDSLELSVAGRYDKDERTQYVDAAQGLYDGAGNITGPIGQPGAVNKATFDMFQPKVTLRYQPTDTATLYASWGKVSAAGSSTPMASALLPPVRA